MSKHLLGRVALATMPALIMLTAMTASPGAAVTNIDACQTLDKFGETYRVTQSLSSCGDCLVVANDRITIDLQEQSIQSACPAIETGDGITDAEIARDAITVKNGSVFDYNVGINFFASRRITLRNVGAALNAASGIAVGELSLVKDCDVRNNGAGIFGRDRVQVAGCHVSHNEAFGIRVGDHCLIQRNEVDLNAFVDGALGGIIAGERCTVVHNVANNNGSVPGIDGAVGIGVGPKSLVTDNMANTNERLGINVVCPSTVTNNTATGNGLANYAFAGTDCFTKNNN